MNKAVEVKREYYRKVDECKLTPMERWEIETRITDTLWDKGYDFVNFVNGGCRYGFFNALSCETSVCELLRTQLEANGFKVVAYSKPDKPSQSLIVFPYNLTVEIESIVDSFEEVKS